MPASTLLLLAIVGSCCACGHAVDGTGASSGAAPPRIELLGFPGCPNTPPMRERLAEALQRLAPGWTYSDVDLTRLPESDVRRGYPAPTVLVDGRDLFGLPTPMTSELACRVYPTGLPTAADLVERLAALRVK